MITQTKGTKTGTQTPTGTTSTFAERTAVAMLIAFLLAVGIWGGIVLNGGGTESVAPRVLQGPVVWGDRDAAFSGAAERYASMVQGQAHDKEEGYRQGEQRRRAQIDKEAAYAAAAERHQALKKSQAFDKEEGLRQGEERRLQQQQP